MAKRLTIRMRAERHTRDMAIVVAVSTVTLLLPLLFTLAFPSVAWLIVVLAVLIAVGAGWGTWWLLRNSRGILILDDEFLIQESENGQFVGQIPLMNIQNVELLGGRAKKDEFKNVAIGIRFWNKKDRDTVWDTFLPIGWELSQHDQFHAFILNEWDIHFNKLLHKLEKAAEESRQDRLNEKRRGP